MKSYVSRTRIVLLVVSIVVFAIHGTRAHAQPNPYHSIDDWPKLPNGRKVGAVSAVYVDRDGNVWTFERCGANSCADSNLAPILKIDPSGKLLESFGSGMFIYPHGIYLDRDGNVWVCDGKAQDGKGQQVTKFSREGKALLKLGTAGVSGEGPNTFNGVSAVVVAPNGDIFVADGHGGDTNARIVKFSKDGKFIKTWGKKGTAPGEFEEPHAIAMDSRGRLFVGDRGNNRIQIFDQDGNYLEEWKQFGRPLGIFIDAKDTIYVADSESDEKRNPGFWPGIRIGNIKEGLVEFFIPALGPPEKPTSNTEGVAADSAGNIYGAEVGSRNLRKYVKN